MTGLESIVEFIVPEKIAEETDIRLRDAGRVHEERFVLWSGIRDRDLFLVRTAHVPRQKAYTRGLGLLVRVEGAELHRLNVWLFEHREMLGVQVHSHPHEAFHSETDDTYPIVTVRGGLSLVVPEFAKIGVRGPDVASYRLGTAGWNELPPEEAQRLIHFED